VPRITATTVNCRHCGSTFRIPDLPAEKLAEVAAMFRAGQYLPSASRLATYTYGKYPRTIFGITISLLPKSPIDPIDAVTAVRHITNPSGACFNCKTPITTPGQSECPHCHALNLNW